MRYLHTMIRVGNLEAATDFFCNKLGLVEMSRYDNEGGRFTLVFLAAPEDVELARAKKAPMVSLACKGGADTRSGAALGTSAGAVRQA